MSVVEVRSLFGIPVTTVTNLKACGDCPAKRNHHGVKVCAIRVQEVDSDRSPTLGEVIDSRINVTKIPAECPNGYSAVKNRPIRVGLA